MIQCRVREIMAKKSRENGKKVRYVDIESATRLSRTTLVKLANDKANLISKIALNKLCWYFDCQPGDLIVYVPDTKNKKNFD